MRYILLIVTFVILGLGGYFLLNSRYEEKYEVMEEDTFPGCEESVLIYTSPYCKYCTNAKKLLDDLKMPYEEVDVHNSTSKRAELAQKTGRNTVPQIYINDHHVGGFDDLKALNDSGKLKKFRETCDLEQLK